MNLLDTYPNIANEWHPSLNAISPQDVAPHFHKKVWWMCGCGHEWESVINNRTSNGNCCPYCSGRLPTEATSLGFLRPDLAKEWHPTKNDRSPYEVTKSGKYRAWWICSICGHEWQTSINSRTNPCIKSGCPNCCVGLQSSAEEIRLWSEIVHVFGKENVKHRWRDLGFEIDVYIPALRAGIEYDGFIWHKDKIAQDNSKYEKIKNHNIFLIRITKIPEALADKVFLSKKMSFDLVQRIIRCLRDRDNNHVFSDYISHYLNAITFQNSDLFKTTYDNMRKRTLECEIKYFDCAF